MEVFMGRSASVVIRATVLTLCVFLAATLTVSAAAPNVRSVSGALVPVVNGNEAEWQTSPTDATNPDWFTFLCSPATSAGCAVPTADLFMRYDCTTNTLYLLAVTRTGNTYAANSANAVQIFPVSGNIIQDAPPYTTNTGPNMWRDLGDGKGFEAAINKVGANNSGPAMTPGTYFGDLFMNINGTTSGRQDIQITMACTPTAVTISTFRAEELSVRENWQWLALGGAGLMALGGVLVFTLRKR
jgi:hypothetical protein